MKQIETEVERRWEIQRRSLGTWLIVGSHDVYGVAYRKYQDALRRYDKPDTVRLVLRTVTTTIEVHDE